MAELFTDPLVILLAIVGVFLTGISKSGFAGGAGVIAVPLLALVIPPTVAVVLVLPLLLLMDAQTITYHRRNLAFAELRLLTPTALLGVVIGSFALGKLNDSVLQFIVGAVSLAFALMQLSPLSGTKSTEPPQPFLGGLMGLIAGITSSLVHAGGPPLNIYLARRQLPRALWISTAAVFFASINLSKVFSYAWVGLWRLDGLLVSLLLVPVAILGVFAGHQIQQRISEQQFVKIIMIALGCSGTILIIKSLSAPT